MSGSRVQSPGGSGLRPSGAPAPAGRDGPSGDGAPPAAPAWTPERLERVRARDPGALAEFFEAHFGRIYALVHRLVGDRTLAEDVTQDVFYKAHRAVDRLDPSRDPGPWLTAIAYNACRDVWRSGHYRMMRRSSPLEAPAASERLASAAQDPERVLIVAEREARVRAAIARLPEPLRAAVLLYEYQGLSHQEIAALLGIAHAAARKRYSRALAALGKLLEEPRP